jgi:nitrate/nitrite transporter NarK
MGGFVALLFLNILNSAYSTVLSLIKDELSLSYTLSGALMSSYFVGYSAGQIPWGYLADRIGSRRVMTMSVLGTALSTILFGFAADTWQVIAARFLAGLLGAGIFVPGVKLIAGWFQPRDRGTALGVLNIGGSVGLVLASWAVPSLSIGLGWRGAMEAFGLVGVLSAVVVWLGLRDRRDSQTSDESPDVRGVVRSRSFWIMASIQFIRLGAYYTFIAWLPLLLHEEYGLSLVAAGTAFSLFNLAGMVSNPVGGFFSDRLGEKLVMLASFLALGTTVLLFVGLKAFLVMYASAFVLGWFINFVRSPSFTILTKLYGTRVAGKISGIQNTFASMGALTLPLILGYVRDATLSYQSGLISLSALFLMGMAADLFIKTT